MNELLTDWRGTAITVGAIIVYPGRHASSLWMTEATVLKITEHKTWDGRQVSALIVQPTAQSNRIVARGEGKPRRVELTAIDRVTVVQA